MKLNLIKYLNVYRISLVIAVVSILFLLAKTVIPSTKISPYATLSFSVLLEEQEKNVLTQDKTTELLAGEKIKGTFKAEEDNLGIVLVRFINANKNNKPSSDLVIFRIKEIKQSGWYYEYAYKIDQFQPHQYFTFGFPKISLSRNKIFTFEIESTAGKKDEATKLSPKMPQVALAYQFSKNELLADKAALLRFIVKKLGYAVLHINLALPLIVYVVSFIALWLLKKVNTGNTDKLYKIAKKIFAQTIYLLWLLLLLIVDFIGGVFSIGQKLYKRLNRVQQYFLLLNKKSFPIFHVLLIFLIAFILRLAFYLNPANVDDFIFSQIGGFGDYDMLIRHTLRFMEEKTLNTYFWSFLDDYIIQVRLFALFFNLFGFIKGLDYLIYLSIIISSLVCLLPFVLSTRLNKFYLGGFAASLLLAINPTLIWISSSRILDALTIFFLSLFIFLLVISLEKKSFVYLLLLGAIAFIGGINRGIMVLTGFASLFLFGIVKKYLYRFVPFLILLFLYSIWAIYYQITFSVPWIYSPQMAAHLFSFTAPVSGAEAGSPVNFILGHIILYILVIIRLVELSSIPIILFAGLIIISFLYIKKPLLSKLIIAVVPITVALFTIFALQNLLPVLQIDLAQFPWRYFTAKQISFYQYMLAGLFVEFIIILFILIKREILGYLIIAFPYFVLLGYSYLKTFSDRHFSQLLLLFFILAALLLDRIFSLFSFKKNAFISLTVFFYTIILFSFIFQKSYDGFRDVVVYSIAAQKEFSYLKFADSKLPKDAIIFSSAQNGENLIWISEFAKRDVIYNVNNQPWVIIPYGKKLPKMPMRAIYPIFHQYDVVDLPDSNSVEEIFNDPKKFITQNFFVLDYNNTRIGAMIASQYGNAYTLTEFAQIRNRKIYKVTKI